MSRRKTVKLNLPKVNDLIKLKFRHRVVFCEAMNRAPNWVTDWNRTDKEGNPAPKNLPSPEEAAQMCYLLNTTPEDILIEDADIALVNEIIKTKGMSLKKLPATMGEKMTAAQKEAWGLIQKWDDEKLKKFIAAAKAMLGE